MTLHPGNLDRSCPTQWRQLTWLSTQMGRACSWSAVTEIQPPWTQFTISRTALPHGISSIQPWCRRDTATSLRWCHVQSSAAEMRNQPFFKCSPIQHHSSWFLFKNKSQFGFGKCFVYFKFRASKKSSPSRGSRLKSFFPLTYRPYRKLFPHHFFYQFRSLFLTSTHTHSFPLNLAFI